MLITFCSLLYWRHVRLIGSDKLMIKIYTPNFYHFSIYRLERVIIPCNKVGAILSSHGERVVSASNDKMWFLHWRQKWNAATAFHCHWRNSLDCQCFNWHGRKPRGCRLRRGPKLLSFSLSRWKGYCSLTNVILAIIRVDLI